MKFEDRILKRHPDASFQEIDGKALVVVPQRAAIEVLSEVGTRVWSLIDGRRTVAEIMDRIAADYDVERAQLEADIQEFVGSLDRAEMLVPQEKES